MFDSLEDTMKHDDHEMVSNKERVIRYATIGAVSVLVFTALVVAVRYAG